MLTTLAGPEKRSLRFFYPLVHSPEVILGNHTILTVPP
jgi:hypothetical protein